MENPPPLHRHSIRWIALSIFLLATIYIFQRVDYINFIGRLTGIGNVKNPDVIFVVNKSLRLVLNDMICFLLIWGLFGERKYLRIAVMVFYLEFFFLLPFYFLIKLNMEGSSEISSPLLSPIHRLIVNPMLMFLLIVAFYYQRFWSGKNYER